MQALDSASRPGNREAVGRKIAYNVARQIGIRNPCRRGLPWRRLR
jgi:hypothetical protein